MLKPIADSKWQGGIVQEEGSIKRWSARHSVKMKPQQPYGCEDFIKTSNAAIRFLCSPLVA